MTNPTKKTGTQMYTIYITETRSSQCSPPPSIGRCPQMNRATAPIMATIITIDPIRPVDKKFFFCSIETQPFLYTMLDSEKYSRNQCSLFNFFQKVIE